MRKPTKRAVAVMQEVGVEVRCYLSEDVDSQGRFVVYTSAGTYRKAGRGKPVLDEVTRQEMRSGSNGYGHKLPSLSDTEGNW